MLSLTFSVTAPTDPDQRISPDPRFTVHPSLQQYVYFISISLVLGLSHVTSTWLNVSLAEKPNITHLKKILMEQH